LACGYGLLAVVLQETKEFGRDKASHMIYETPPSLSFFAFALKVTTVSKTSKRTTTGQRLLKILRECIYIDADQEDH
jgi:hypothetical protein